MARRAVNPITASGTTINLSADYHTDLLSLNVGARATLTINCPTNFAPGFDFTIMVTATATSCVITFGSGFKTQGTLTTGTVAGKVFALCFASDGTNLVETSRTVAM